MPSQNHIVLVVSGSQGTLKLWTYADPRVDPRPKFPMKNGRVLGHRPCQSAFPVISPPLQVYGTVPQSRGDRMSDSQSQGFGAEDLYSPRFTEIIHRYRSRRQTAR